ncbi:kinase-like protein [Jackrogersella minutella]|nr:kinase-like protein [Jackrogersella minutella]
MTSFVNKEVSLDNTDINPMEDRIEYELLDDDLRVEDIQMYNRGGHHPVHLDDILDNRFEVVHKLGNGSFGIVWLCRDIELEKWRAIKIMTAENSSKGIEGKICRHLQQNLSINELAKNHITMPLEEFWLEGPNGRHLCLVMPIMGMDISNWRVAQKNAHEEMVADTKAICGQVIEALHFLHGQGICHGDIKPGNILMEIEGVDDLDKDQILDLMGEPDLIEVETVSGNPPGPRAPEYCVAPADTLWCEKLLTRSITMIDFGESFFANSPPKSTGVPDMYAAPEVLLHSDIPGTHSDIWSLACLIFEICAGNPLFISDFGIGLYSTVQEFEFYLGALPEPHRKMWWQKLSELRKRSHLNNNSTEQSTELDTTTTELEPVTQSLDQLIEDRNTLTEKSQYSDVFEATLGRERNIYQEGNSPEVIKYRYPQDYVQELSDLLRKMLNYNPATRISTSMVISHPWIGKGRSNNLDIKRSMDIGMYSRQAAILSFLVVLAIACILSPHIRSEAIKWMLPGSKPAKELTGELEALCLCRLSGRHEHWVELKSGQELL